MAACAGSVAVLFIIMAVAMRVRDIMTILILGILFGSAVSAIVSIIQYFSEQSVLKTFIVWTMGNLGSLTRPQLNVLLLSVLSGLMLTIFSIKKLNLLLAGETYARSLGVNIKAARFLVFISTGILTGSITAFCGPIGFVGIAVPHIVRTLLGSSDHRLTVQGCILAGGILLLSSDLLSQIPGMEPYCL
jgi:iron complex transport system permease protein